MLIFSLFPLRVQAQSSFNSGGGDDAVSLINVSYSIGQLFYEPFSSYGGILKVAPGVQQVYSVSEVSSNETVASVGDIMLYPNPVTDYLELLFNGEEPSGEWQATLYDLAGNLIAGYSVNTPLTRIQADRLAPGVYLLKVTTGNIEIKTFKVIKK